VAGQSQTRVELPRPAGDPDAAPGEPDGMTANDFASTVTAIATAFGNPTRREIFLAAHDSETGVTATEMAKRFDLHANVARHHLDKLVAGGYLEVSTERPRRPGAGRPSKHYRAPIDAAGQRGELQVSLPVKHDDLLITLLGKALELLPPDEAERMAEEVGVEYGRTLTTRMGTDGEHSFRAALHAVADALAGHGFATRAEQHGTELRIVAEHCPFGGAAVQHPVICAVDRGLVRGMLGSLYGEASTQTESSLPMGDDVCITAVDDH
jgi:predicted ArsR family transcriptional regulator